MTTAIRRRGFTLVEMVISSAIVSILLAAMTSAMLVAARAAPGRNGTADLTFGACRSSDQLEADIACATGFTILGTGSIEMQVPDRTGDGLADTVRYAWSGNSGDSLYRTFNGGTAVAVATDVRNFNLTYVKTATKQPTSYTESGETLILGTDNGSLIYPSYTVTGSGGIGNSFLPTYASGAAYLRITRADFLLRSNGPANTATVEAVLRVGTAANSISTSVVDCGQVIAPALIANWVEATYTQNVQITPGSFVQLTLMDSGAGNDFVAAYRVASIANAVLAVSTDNKTWSCTGSDILPAYVYGVYGTKNADSYVYTLMQVGCTLKCGNSSSAQIQSDFRALNTPQVTGP